MPRTPKRAVARARKAGDDSYNARRRYLRSAERNLKKASSATGATAARFRTLAESELKSALETYDPSNRQGYSKQVQRLAQSLNVDLDEMRQGQVTRLLDGREVAEPSEVLRKRQQKAIEESTQSLVGDAGKADLRREREARIIFGESSVGKRIMAGLVDVWYEPSMDWSTGKIDRSKILPALFDYFKVDNLADMLQKVEDVVGERLYADGDSEGMYETVKLVLQAKVADNTLVE